MTAATAPATAQRDIADAARRAPGPGRHIPALDGIRGMAILLVMLLHMNINPDRVAADGVFRWITSFGWIGVDMFFVLSGFLITGILFDAKGSNHYFKTFYMRRTVRIFPLYYLFLVLALFALPLLSLVYVPQWMYGQQHWFWLYLSNFRMATQGGWAASEALLITWSLAIEEQFYLLWPAVVFCCGRRTLLRVCVGCILAAFVTRLVVWSLGGNWLMLFFLTPCRLDALCIGAFIALTWRGPRGMQPLLRHTRWLAPLCIAAIAGLAVDTGNLGGQNKIVLTFGLTFVGLLFGCVVARAAVATDGTLGHRLWNNRVLLMFGKYSYAMYLFHVPVLTAVERWLYAPTTTNGHNPLLGTFWMIGSSQLPGQMVFYAISITLTVVVAMISWHVYEKHFLKLKKLFPYR